MVTVNANREHIQEEVEKSVSKSAEDLFGITAHSLQIAAPEVGVDGKPTTGPADEPMPKPPPVRF